MKLAVTKAPSSSPMAAMPLDHPDVAAAIEVSANAVQGAMAEVVARLRAEHAAELARLSASWTKHLSALEKRAKAADETVKDLTKRVKASADRLEKAARAVSAVPPAPPSTAQVPAQRAVGQAMPELTPAAAAKPEVSVKDWLEAQGFEVVDRRVKGGGLWVVGPDEQVKRALKNLKRRGVEFIYVAAGSSATKKRPGWYTLSKQ